MNGIADEAPYARVFVKEHLSGMDLILIEHGDEAYPFAGRFSEYATGPQSEISAVRKEMVGISPVIIRDKKSCELVDNIITEYKSLGAQNSSSALSKSLEELIKSFPVT